MRIVIRRTLIFLLVVSAGFAAWAWLRPYAWGADGAARCKVVGCQVKQDRSNHWLDVHLKVVAAEGHDFSKPVVLELAGGRKLEPADTTIEKGEAGAIRQLWLKFWLENGDWDGPLDLRINDGVLSIRSGSGVPALGAGREKYFTTNRW